MVLFVVFFTVFSNRHDPKAKQCWSFYRAKIKFLSYLILTFYCVRISTFAPYFLQILFWVDVTISSQNSFDKIVTSYFWWTPTRRRDENWLHEARSLISHTTFKNLDPDTNVHIYLKILRRVIYFLRYLKNLMIFWKIVIFWLLLGKKYWNHVFFLGSYFNAN